jgi:hypothetical protein
VLTLMEPQLLHLTFGLKLHHHLICDESRLRIELRLTGNLFRSTTTLTGFGS